MKPIDKIKQIIFDMNEKGIPLPVLRDPDKNGPSLSYMFYYITGWLMVASLVGKLSGLLGTVDTMDAVYAFLAAGGMYHGRKILSDGKSVTVESNEKEEDKKE